MNHDQYEAALHHSAWRDMSHFGRFRLGGKDAMQLLHHLTTNDIKGLRAGGGCDAALVSHKARVLDWLTVFRDAEGFMVITSPNRREIFEPHARKFILFRQEVTIADVTDDTAMFGLCGPETPRVLAAVGAGALSSQAPNDHQKFEHGGVHYLAAPTRRLPGIGALLWSDDAAGLRGLVASSGAPLLDNETYNVLRVEAGIPVAGLELTQEINPWEAGLDEFISLHKGCYNGQEVVARLHTYKKVKQGLRGLRLSQPVPMGQRAELTVAGKAAGFLTSSVDSPRFGPIALAYLRGDYQAEGQQVQVAGPTGAQTATVADLPFV